MEQVGRVTQTDKNEVLLQFFVEQFGEQVQELSEKIENSYTKLRLKGGKDEIADLVEDLRNNPLKITMQALRNCLEYFKILVHNKLMTELFKENKGKINYVYGVRKSFTYAIQLKENTFQERDFFRRKLFNIYGRKPYTQFLNVSLEFMPDDVLESDFLEKETIKLELTA